MYKFISCLTLIIFLTSCKNKTENKSINLKAQEVKASTFDRNNLDYYFNQNEIKPLTAVNNLDGNRREIELLNHRIKWLNTNDETKIKIDDDLFTLKDYVTTNIVWSHNDSVDFSNDWDEMKLYKINGRELIGIRMLFDPCTGLGCSVNYFLVYDIKTKSKNFFGTFRTDNKLALYNFRNDDKIDYISKTFSGDAHGSTPMLFIYELYSMEEHGYFVKQENNEGQVYQIKQTTFPNDTTKSETFEQTWLTEIK